MISENVISPPSAFARIIILLERDRKTRFSGGLLGYLWAYITPTVWIAFIVGLFLVLERTAPIHVDLEIFVATGVLPYVIFRQTITSMSRVLSAHRYMLYFRAVTQDDILFSTMLLEGFNLLISAVLIFGAVTVLFGNGLPTSVPGVLFGLGLAWMLGCGIGRFVAYGSQLSDTFARLVPLILRPFFWLSGIFYVAAELPGRAQDVLWFSPFLHVTEIIREGYFLGFSSGFADAWYPFAVAAVFYLASIPLERFAKHHRIMRRRL
jgi:ABC-type polysaccharide/polyol phosphate export permease